MSTDQDQARLIAERVARRVSENRPGSAAPRSSSGAQNGAPVREEISSLREGLHDLESKLDRIESRLGNGAAQAGEPSRARVIDFISTGPPLRSAASIGQPLSAAETFEQVSPKPPAEFFQFVPPTQSPWLGRLSSMLGGGSAPAELRPPQPADHPSEERFGVEEATVKELVEFFENEKKCAIDPSGKPCDHCAMCSSRGF